MRIVACQACGQAVYFETWRCNQCGATLGFVPEAFRLAALEVDADAFWTPLPASSALKRPGLPARFLCRRPEPPTGDIARKGSGLAKGVRS